MCPEHLLTKRPDTFAQTNLSSTFRLQYGDGPYIPSCPRLTRNPKSSTDSAPTSCHPERSLSRTRSTQSKDLRLLLNSGVPDYSRIVDHSPAMRYQRTGHWESGMSVGFTRSVIAKSHSLLSQRSSKGCWKALVGEAISRYLPTFIESKWNCPL